MDDRIYEPKIFFSVDVRQAGCDMIEAVGMIAAGSLNEYTMKRAVRDIEKAAATLTRSIASYKRAMAAGQKELSRSEYDADEKVEEVKRIAELEREANGQFGIGA